MSGNPRIRRRPSGPAGHCCPPQPPAPPDPWAEADHGPGMSAVAGPQSFWRIVPIPFRLWVAALDTWQLTGPGGELRLGHNVLRGPAEHDPHFGTCRIEVRLARGPLRPRARMQLHIDHWSATATAVELIPHGHIRPTAAYFRAGRALLDSLTRALPARPPVPRSAGVPPCHPPADQAEPRTTAPGRPATGPEAIPARQKA
jgi:hypothetical protein